MISPVGRNRRNLDRRGRALRHGVGGECLTMAERAQTWREEIAKFFPHLAVDVLKTGHDFTQRTDPVIWLASYTQLRKHRQLLEGVEFGYAVLDEGQFIKNPDAKVTQTCFAVRAEHRIVLTGTPLENRQLDLWSIFRFLLPGLLGSRASFEAALVADRDGTLTRLRTQLSPFILRRTKGDVAQDQRGQAEARRAGEGGLVHTLGEVSVDESRAGGRQVAQRAQRRAVTALNRLRAGGDRGQNLPPAQPVGAVLLVVDHQVKQAVGGFGHGGDEPGGEAVGVDRDAHGLEDAADGGSQLVLAESGQGRADAGVVGNAAVIVERHIEVDTQEYPLALEVELAELENFHRVGPPLSAR